MFCHLCRTHKCNFDPVPHGSVETHCSRSISVLHNQDDSDTFQDAIANFAMCNCDQVYMAFSRGRNLHSKNIKPKSLYPRSQSASAIPFSFRFMSFRFFSFHFFNVHLLASRVFTVRSMRIFPGSLIQQA